MNTGSDAAPAGRRRGEVLHRAILDAGLAELGEQGYAGFSMERVARRAGTGKAALYRRWPDRDHLILDCVRGGVPAGRPVTYSGDLREDLRGVYRGTAMGLQSPVGHAIRAVLTETHRRPELLDALHEVVFDPGARALRAMLAGAVEAGEIEAEVVEREVVTAGHEMLMFVFMTAGTVTVADADRVTDDLMAPVLGLGR